MFIKKSKVSMSDQQGLVISHMPHYESQAYSP